MSPRSLWLIDCFGTFSFLLVSFLEFLVFCPSPPLLCSFQSLNFSAHLSFASLHSPSMLFLFFFHNFQLHLHCITYIKRVPAYLPSLPISLHPSLVPPPVLCYLISLIHSFLLLRSSLLLHIIHFISMDTVVSLGKTIFQKVCMRQVTELLELLQDDVFCECVFF